ncbi:hypothetical protein [Pseudoramibacter sp.]|jgi:hypothetical protein|uniref:hypothetical protein n=1 Tax=Pseudoramibacter sp. TaxID=2034862 RepID=UPI0025DFFCA1|nr:hypothetical protein [Pseudoramibacter sp.]MCH4071442.1 hypothetical protein [Pseudoramibacter sp.]MCH4105210.1 hypothetical protein [Pseudoramibacter sp.]
MEKQKMGWRSVTLYVLAVIFLAAFFYGIFISVSQIASMVAQYKAMGTTVPHSYVVQQICLGVTQYAFPPLFFSVMCAVVARILNKLGLSGSTQKAEKAETAEAAPASEDKGEKEEVSEKDTAEDQPSEEEKEDKPEEADTAQD